jgi:ketopantoate reductase
MRIVVFGTGGVGGYFGGRVAQSGEDVTFIARGEHLRAIQTSGLRVDSQFGDFLIHKCGVPTSGNRVVHRFQLLLLSILPKLRRC